MSRRRRGILPAALAALAVIAAALLTPERAAEPPPFEGHPFTWGEDALFARLEREFDAAREAGCEARTAALDDGLEALDLAIDRVHDSGAADEEAALASLEARLFAVAPHFGACLDRVPELAARVARLRRVVKDRSLAWAPDDRAARDRLYRLLYGSRAALEELLLQMPDPSPLALLAGTDEPSETPSTTIRGVTLHSGDILVSRGGAPTSALIARGNDYPGNFSHVALLHVAEDGTPTVIESHIESGVGAFTAERYLEDTKLRIMVLRLRADLPAVRAAPDLPHRAASHALERARGGHIPYDFAMDDTDPSQLFCSEVASDAYRSQGVELWRGRSSLSGPGLTRWLAAVGVTHFETQSPSDLEHDPQVTVVAEWRGADTLFADHADNAVIDVLLEGAEAGDDIGYDYPRLPLARLAKAYSVVLNLFGEVGPIPEGMSATTGLRVEWLRARHGAIRAGLERRAEAYRATHGRRPPYWTLVRLAREARDELDRAAR